MKVCVISSTVFAVEQNGLQGYGGLEQIAWQIAKGLAAKGHEVSLVSPEGSICPGASIISCGPPGGWDERKAYSTYWQQLLHYDAIIDHSWQKWPLTLKMEGVLKAPVLEVCHAPVNTMFQAMPNLEKPCFVCISQDQADHFQALFNKIAKVAYNGIDLNFYRPLGIPRSDRFLFLARFSTIKGPDLAIEACLKAGVGLDLIGDTSITNEPELLQKCKAMADGKQIRIIGPASRGECVWWFSQAHCLLHANKLFREPYGLSPVESMACGTPVIAWDYGAMRETIGEGGKLVKSLDEMVDLIKGPYHPKQFTSTDQNTRIRCREQASKFSEQRMVDRYEELCFEAIKTGGW